MDDFELKLEDDHVSYKEINSVSIFICTLCHEYEKHQLNPHYFFELIQKIYKELDFIK